MTRSRPEHSGESSLYEELGEAIPATVAAAGETRITETKETVDNDTEDVSDDDILTL